TSFAICTKKRAARRWANNACRFLPGKPSGGFRRLISVMKYLVVAAALVAAPAYAGIELVGKVNYTLNLGTIRMRDVGDPRYMAMQQFAMGDRDAEVDVLDFATATTHHVSTSVRELARTLRTQERLEAELVFYTPGKIGVHVTDGILERGHHHWYVELD